MTETTSPAPTRFTFHSDPGHGWLLVRAEDLARAGLGETDITPYSYRGPDGTIALEEDGDLPVFLGAWEARVGPVEIREDFVPVTPVRSWQRFGTRTRAA